MLPSLSGCSFHRRTLEMLHCLHKGALFLWQRLSLCRRNLFDTTALFVRLLHPCAICSPKARLEYCRGHNMIPLHRDTFSSNTVIFVLFFDEGGTEMKAIAGKVCVSPADVLCLFTYKRGEREKKNPWVPDVPNCPAAAESELAVSASTCTGWFFTSPYVCSDTRDSPEQATWQLGHPIRAVHAVLGE